MTRWIDPNWVKEQLIDRGFTKQQTERRIVQAVIDVVLMTSGEYEQAFDMRSELIKLHGEIDDAERVLERTKRYTYEATLDCEKAKEMLEEEKNEWQEQIKSCETASARDRMRIARFFMDNTEIKTPQNNSVYIKGLADILAGTGAKDTAEAGEEG